MKTMHQEREKLGGSKGGKIRAERLSAEQRRQVARKAVQPRWAKVKQETRSKSESLEE